MLNGHSAAKHSVAAIIPVLNEETAITDVVAGVRVHVQQIIVVDGNSTDRTAERARAAGETVIIEPRRGYGRAMRAGVQGYFTFLSGRSITYFGRTGDQHTEWFPGADPKTS